jgi:hypothetical protein
MKNSNMKTKYLLVLLPLFLTLSASAQTEKQKATDKMIDSIKMAMLSQYAESYPVLRQGFLATDFIAGRTVTGELNGKDLYQGKVNIERIRSNFNIPLAQWGKNTITGTVSYQQIHFETDDVTSFSSSFPSTDQSVNKSTVGLTATFTRTDSIFNHPINYSGSVSGLTDETSSVKRVNYLGLITVPISRSKYSSFTVGVVVTIDPSTVEPVIPIISYWHKFQASDLDLYVDLPSRIALRKQLSKKAWATIGSELGGNIYFFDLNQPSLPQNNIYSTIDIRSGATFEYLVTKKLVLGVSGGLYTVASSRMFGQDDKPDQYFFRTSNGSSPYISFSISFLPFIKSLK